MIVKTGTWIPPLIAAAVLVAVIAWQRGAARSVHRQLEAMGADIRTLEIAEEKHRALVASGISDTELERLRADHAALVRLRAELDALRAAVRAKTPSAPPPAKPAETPTSAWRAAGSGTPVDAMHTAMWAMGSGELAAFAERITADPADRAAMDEVFSKLPADVRARHGTLEAWIAAATAGTVPVGSLRILQQDERGPDEVELTVQLQGRRGTSAAVQTKSAHLILRRGGDGWRFVVPLSTVQQFAKAQAANQSAIEHRQTSTRE